MTQTITPNFDLRYTVLFVEKDERGDAIRLIEEPVVAWLHEHGEDGETVTVRPLHPSGHLPGARHLRRPTGDLANLKGGYLTPAGLVRSCRLAGIEQKDMHVLNPEEWRLVFDELAR